MRKRVGGKKKSYNRDTTSGVNCLRGHFPHFGRDFLSLPVLALGQEVKKNPTNEKKKKKLAIHCYGQISHCAYCVVTSGTSDCQNARAAGTGIVPPIIYRPKDVTQAGGGQQGHPHSENLDEPTEIHIVYGQLTF